MKSLTHRSSSLLLLHSFAGDAAALAPGRQSRPFSLWLRLSARSFSSSSSNRRFEEDGKNVKVAVWWDLENCNIPVGVNVFRVAQRITSALRSNGIKGPVTITAFGDVSQLSRASQEALVSTGVCLNHVPCGGKNSSDRFFMADLLYWVQQNPPPAHLFLISGDRDFANILHRLRMCNYNILLASKDAAPGVLCSAATIMWSWPCLVKGENAGIKHFNHPPDGLYGSRYGHYKAVLDDPFFDVDQASNSQSEESMKLISETKPRPIPRAFVNAIRKILYSYPEGIDMSELRSELKKSNVTMDKDFFGYKKFSHLLASMPSVLKFLPNASLEGQPLVVGTHRRIADSPLSMIKQVQDVDVSDAEKSHTPKQNEKPLSVKPTPSNELDTASSICKTSLDKKETITDSGKHTSIHTQEQVAAEGGLFKRIMQTFSGFQHGEAETFSSSKANGMEANHYVSSSEQRKNIEVERGFLQRIWRAWNGPIAGHATVETNSISGLSLEDSGKAKSTCKTTEKSKFEDKAAKLNNSFSNESSTSLSSLEAGKLLGKDKTFGESELTGGSPDTRKSFFSWIANWWIFWKSDQDQEITSAPQKQVMDDKGNNTSTKSNNNLNNIIHESKPLDPFSKGCFWDALESFLLTSKGTDLILKSRTREQLVRRLKKEGPWVLKDLTEAELFELINSMIVEKKWLEESTSEMFPFKLSLVNKQNGVPSHIHGSSNGLSSLFRSKILKSNLQKEVQQDQNSGSSFDQTLRAKTPQNFRELRSWFQKVYKGFEDVEPEALQKLFESKFNTKLVSSIYGHSDLQSLVAACLADEDYKLENRKSSPSREKILQDCQKLLAELFHEYPDGFNISIFKSAFLHKYDHALDIQMLGYPKLASLLQIMPGVRIESTFVIPAERFHTDSSWTKQPVCEKVVSNSQDDKGNVINKDSEGEGNAEDRAWEELGPVSGTVINKVSNTDQVKDGEATYDEASLSDEIFSDSEGESPSQLEEQEGKSKRCGENSSLIQILDSWYSRKDADEKEQAQESAPKEDASSSKECGEKNQAEAERMLVDAKPTNKQKKVMHSKRYSFVSESRIDNEKMVDSILESLKKTGDSKLNSCRDQV